MTSSSLSISSLAPEPGVSPVTGSRRGASNVTVRLDARAKSTTLWRASSSSDTGGNVPTPADTQTGGGRSHRSARGTAGRGGTQAGVRPGHRPLRTRGSSPASLTGSSVRRCDRRRCGVSIAGVHGTIEGRRIGFNDHPNNDHPAVSEPTPARPNGSAEDAWACVRAWVAGAAGTRRVVASASVDTQRAATISVSGFVVLVGSMLAVGALAEVLVFDSTIGRVELEWTDWVARHRVGVLDSAAAAGRR